MTGVTGHEFCKVWADEDDDDDDDKRVPLTAHRLSDNTASGPDSG